jgi:hypothetical protein
MLHVYPSLAGLGRDVPEELFSLSENRELFRRWRADEGVSED